VYHEVEIVSVSKNKAVVVTGILCALSLLVSSPAWSGKLYKWVDKNGQTHYSQIPPQKDQVKDPSSVSEKSAGSTIPVTRKGDYAYCGDMKLPGPLYEPKRMLLRLGSQVEGWQKSLRSSEESLTHQLRSLGDKMRREKKYKTYSSNSGISYTDSASERRKSTSRKIKQYRCAIAWAERQKKKYADVKQEVAHDLKGAKSNYQAALDAAHQDCGFEPKDYASANYNAKKSAWKKCMRPHDRKIRASKRNLSKLRKEANNLD
jgi:hypothetical protein